jgi:glycosyltransferase involved in cell wall biosynthesis
VRVCLLSTGTDGISGGHRYHQHLLAAAPRAGFVMWVARPRIAWTLPPADVVVIDSLYAWRAAVAVRRRHRPLAVAIVHQHPGGTDASGRMRSLRHRLDVATYRHCDLVVTPGPIMANLLATEHELDPTRIQVIEPGCDLPPAKKVPALRAGRRLGLLNVANWLPNKGILELLEAVAALPPHEVTLHLAGRTDVAPQYTSVVQRRIEKPDLADRTVVHGALGATEVASLYAAADAFAFPSRLETYGSAVAEALAAGLPIIGWRTAHLCALVADETEGLLVAPGRIDELAAAIHRLAVDDDERRRLAEGARRRGARLPTWPQTTSRFFDALGRLVAKPVEPPHNPVAPVDVDATDTGVLDIEGLGDRGRHAERPADRRLDRADMGHDDHH